MVYDNALTASCASAPSNQGRNGFVVCDIRKKSGFHVGRLIHAGRGAILQQINQYLLFTCGWIFQQFHQCSGLLGIQWEWWQTKRGALGNVGMVGS